MSWASFILAMAAIVLFMVEFFRTNRDFKALGLAVLTLAWVFQTVYVGAERLTYG